METTVLSEGCEYSFIHTTSFKTTLISATFITDLNSETAAANTLAIKLLKRGGSAYSSEKILARKLADLYGAELLAGTMKCGDRQVLRITLSCLNDNYALDGEDTVNSASELFCNLIFNNIITNSAFSYDMLHLEKRLLFEEIAAVNNDKRRLARIRCEELACQGEPYSLQPTGTEDQVNAQTVDSVFYAYKKLLNESFIKLQVVGSKEPQNIKDLFCNGLKSASRNFSQLSPNMIKPPRKTTETIENMDVHQGKLVMALRCNKTTDSVDALPFLIMTDIFGGAPYSKLFTNVREKMSLCYYCSARPVREKGLIFVESGVEKDNIEKAKTAILKQLCDIKNGIFSDDVLSASKLSNADSYRSLYGDQTSLDIWYALKSIEKNRVSLEEFISAIDNITREDIINAASDLELDTVYIINPTGGAQDD